MAKRKSKSHSVASRVAKTSTSYLDYAKKLAAMVAAGIVGAAVNQYVNPSSYSQLRTPDHRPGRMISVDLDTPTGQLGGRGAYTWRDFGRGALTGAGSVTGGLLGGVIAGGPTGGTQAAYGAGIGGTIGGGIGRSVGEYIFGRGAYTVARNSLFSNGSVLPEGTEVPTFADSDRFTRITHREFVQDIVVPATPTAFTNTSFVINPGNSALFPWLASIAANYQQYEIMGMVVCFKSTSTDFSTSGALGSVVLATNYDVLETPFVSKVIMENSQYAVSSKPSLSQLHAIECDPKLTSVTTKYIRNASSSFTLSQDNRFYDHGLFQLATVGLSATPGTVLGELWVTYDIKLLKPEIANSVSLTQGQHILSGGTVSKTAVFGTAPTTVGANYATATTNTLTFTRVGQFLVEVEVGGSILFDPGETAVGLTFVEIVNLASGPSQITMYTVTVTAPAQTLALDYSGSTTVGASSVRIASYASVNA